MKNKSGFTLIELIVVMGLVLTIIFMAAPHFVRSYQSRNIDFYLKDLQFFLRYMQFKAIEEGKVQKLVLDPDTGELQGFVKKGRGPEEFEKISVPIGYEVQKHTRFMLQLKNGNQIYFFPDGALTPNRFLIMEGMEERASLNIRNRLGAFQVVRHD